MVVRGLMESLPRIESERRSREFVARLAEALAPYHGSCVGRLDCYIDAGRAPFTSRVWVVRCSEPGCQIVYSMRSDLLTGDEFLWKVVQHFRDVAERRKQGWLGTGGVP